MNVNNPPKAEMSEGSFGKSDGKNKGGKGRTPIGVQ